MSPPLKSEVLSNLSFWKFGKRFKPPPPQQKEGGCAHYFYSQHSNLYQSANLFVYSFLHSASFQQFFIPTQWFHFGRGVSIFIVNHIFIYNSHRFSIMLPFSCHVILWRNCSTGSTGSFMILYFVKICLFLLNAGILSYAESYYLIALSII